MLVITGKLKQDQIKEITKKDGTTIKRRFIYLDTEENVYPIKISVEDQSFRIGKVGDQVSLAVHLYPFYIQDREVKRARLNFYVPSEE